MSIKFRIKRGSTELEYEGSEEFLKDNLTEVLGSFSEFSAENLSSSDGSGSTTPENGGSTSEEKRPGSGASNETTRLQMATNSIAVRLKVKSGPDLVTAACAHLDLGSGKDTFTRKEILEDMKSASNYYKDSYSKNLTHSLSTLLKDNKLVQRSSDNYALTADQRKRLETDLGQQ